MATLPKTPVMIELPTDLPEFVPGSVWLVGAGPGDPGLLSVLGLHGLRNADIVVYDALVSDGLLGLAPPCVRLEHAGKRGGRPSARQPDISRRLVALAREGKRVLRLKGGDPFVFGRGGEEARALLAADVPFRLIPGITSGIGGLAYAGIAVSSASGNAAMTLLTGHDASGTVPRSLDWAALARGDQLLVFYMALKHLPQIVTRLIDGGRHPDTPVAVVSKATTARQRVLISTLRVCVLEVAARDIEPPAIVAVGESVRLHDTLAWFDSGA